MVFSSAGITGQDGRTSKMADQDTITQRIIKLLAKAERAGSPEEAEAFFAKAADLQAKHAIDEIMLNAAAGKNADDVEDKTYDLTGIYSKAHILMLNALARELNCRVIQYSSGGSKNLRARVHGFHSDLERLDILFTSVMVQASRSLKQWWGAQDSSWWTAAEKFQARKSYIIGYGEGAATKLRESMRTAVAEHKSGEPGVSLVLVDRKDKVDAAVAAAHGRLGTARSTKVNGAATRAGRSDGQRADVGHRRVGGSNRALGR
jgi:hypothetical protein